MIDRNSARDEIEIKIKIMRIVTNDNRPTCGKCYEAGHKCTFLRLCSIAPSCKIFSAYCDLSRHTLDRYPEKYCSDLKPDNDCPVWEAAR